MKTKSSEPLPATARASMKGLNWAGRGAPAFNGPDGWFVGEATPSLPFGFAKPRGGGGNPQDFDGLIVMGQRVAALGTIREHLGSTVGFAYLDLPRLSMAPVADDRFRLPTWLTTVESHVSAAAATLGENGALAVHIDDEGAAYVRLILEDLFGRSAHQATVLWQKKYAPQNDLHGRIDDAHDFIFVFRPGADFGTVPPDKKGFWWPFQYAGKTEDATREVEQLRKAGVVSLSNIPKTSKPERLIARLLEHFGDGADLVLEVFSDTGFASAAALSKGRRAILLGGDTPRERTSVGECAHGRLAHALRARGGPKARLKELEVDQPAPARAVKLNLRDTPVHFGPARDTVARQSRAPAVTAQLRPIRIADGAALDGGQGFPSMRVQGEPLATLVALAPAVRASAKLTIVDCDDSPSEPDEEAWARWIAELRDRLDACGRLLDPDGFVAVALDDASYAPARLVASGEIGRQRYAGTIAIATETGSELPGTIRFFAVFRPMVEVSPRKIGLPANREYTNPDDDPRGDWRDPGHKGARSGGKNTAFTYYLPPYRWELVRGSLPTGAWRLNPVSGVIWAPALERAGTHRFVVRVTDSAGAASEATCEIVVAKNGEAESADEVWWMSGTVKAAAGAPKIIADELPRGVVGQPYRAILRARGGQPFSGSTVPGEPTSDGKRTRYWEFADYTLAEAILEDDVLFGPRGDAKPRIKRRPDASGRWSVNVELSWWDSERLAGEKPVDRLARILSTQNELVVAAAPHTPATMVALDGDRRLVQIVADAAENVSAHLDEALGTYDLQTRVLTLNYAAAEFAERIAWLEGFLPPNIASADLPTELRSMISGVAPGAKEACLMLPAETWPTAGFCKRVAEQLHPHFSRLVIYHFRGTPPRSIPGVEFRRIPFDLACRPRR